MKLLNALDRLLAWIETPLVAICTIAALILGVAQVILRYVFNTGFTWSESLFVLLTVAAMLFAGSQAVREDRHVRVDLMWMIVPASVRRVLQVLSHVAALALCGLFVYGGIQYVRFVHMIDTVSPETNLPDWLVFALVPITMGMFALRYVIRLARALRGEDVDFMHRPTAPEPDRRP